MNQALSFGWRFVKYGTRFSQDSAFRRASNYSERNCLFANEIAVDVGSTCWGYQGSEVPVIDHHFQREQGNFPAASVGVIHHAARLARKALGLRQNTEWLRDPLFVFVTHAEPDFDALCACYLAESIVTSALETGCEPTWVSQLAPMGIHPDGWEYFERISADGSKSRWRLDWFEPLRREIPEECKDLRWMVLLASVAAYTDTGRPSQVAIERRPSSVLYARLARGVPMAKREEAKRFFDTLRTRIHEDGINPLVDSVFEDVPAYKAELRLLDRAYSAYQRDIRRSRRSIVRLPRFKSALEYAQGDGSRTFERSPSEIQARDEIRMQDISGLEGTTPAEGIWIRDPECILFKNFAREDTVNSRSGEGFLFTAVAYSGRKRANPVNDTDYYFSLDPEKARGLHLDAVWRKLMEHEVRVCFEDSTRWPQLLAENPRPRTDFAYRAGEWGPFFNDPWYDGNSYEFTIVQTPNGGTLIGTPGSAADLSDDPVAEIVQSVLETDLLRRTRPDRPVGAERDLLNQLIDHPATQSCALENAARSIPPHTVPVPSGHYRFVSFFVPGAEITRTDVVSEVTQQLQRWLRPELPGTREDAETVIERGIVGVWSGNGIALAYSEDGADTATELAKSFVALCEQSCILQGEFDRSEEPNLKVLENLSKELTKLQLRFAKPDFRLLRRFAESTQLAHVAESARRMTSSRQGRESMDDVRHVQKNIEYAEVFLLAIYAVELIHFFLADYHHSAFGVVTLVGTAAVIGTSLVAYFVFIPQGGGSHAADKEGAGAKRKPWNLGVGWLYGWLLLLTVITIGLSVYLHAVAPPAQSSYPASPFTSPGADKPDVAPTAADPGAKQPQ